MSRTAQEEFERFQQRAGANAGVALAFFVGYASGASGVRQNIEEIVAAFKAADAELAASESRP